MGVRVCPQFWHSLASPPILVSLALPVHMHVTCSQTEHKSNMRVFSYQILYHILIPYVDLT